MPDENKKREEELLKAAKSMQKAMAPMIANMQAISRSMQPILRATEAMRLNILPILKRIESWQKSFIPIFDKIDFKKLEAKAKEMKTPAFKKFIKDWGWLVNKKSISFGDYCYGLYKKYGDREFKNKVNGWFYYRDNLDTVLEEIKLKFPERYNIIKEGFNYHAKRNYSCSITLLLPHAEGILWDLGVKEKYVRKGYNSKKKYSKYINNSKDEWKLEELSKKLFPNDKFHNIIVKEIFCEGPRNRILHGRNVYNKKVKEISRWKSTLLILTLWRLSDEF